MQSQINDKASIQLSSVAAHANKRFSSGSALVVLTILVGMSIAAYGVYKIRGYKRPVQPFENFKSVKLTNGDVVTAAMSPDGKKLAYVTSETGKQTIWFSQVGSQTKRAEIISTPEVNYQSVTFSPDGNAIYFVGAKGDQANSVSVVKIQGGSANLLFSNVDSPVGISPDGKSMAFLRVYPGNETALIVASTSGNIERKIAGLKSPSGFVLQAKPSWTADGKRIAVAAQREDESTPSQHLLVIGATDGRIAVVDRTRWRTISGVAWMEDGNSLLLTGSQDRANNMQVWQVLYPTGVASRITNDAADYELLNLTGDSKQLLALQHERQANIWIAPEGDETRAVQVSSGGFDGLEGVSFSPEGQIIYTATTNGRQDLYMIDAKGGNVRQLTQTGGINRTPVVSPDGKYVVFASDRSGTVRLWRVDLNGENAVELTSGVNDSDPQFTPDGQSLIYTSDKGGIRQLFRVSVNGGDSKSLTDRCVATPAVSPDGRFIACSYRESDSAKTNLLVLSIDGGNPTKTFELPPFSTGFSWTRQGDAVTYVQTTAGTSNIWRQRLDGTPAHQVTNFKSDQLFGVAWSSDGKWLAYSRGKAGKDAVLFTRN